ncbi:hypothetical protein EVAR_5940_1 [Eumeta japonica]|uniref:Uncharacterized protein n=1 Tax=Eumeta variegata TaxID=151549 RepID=A0A4C1TC67_EUMVA|nr:hypothetical protein EVAR_5940_1 [Eumeta japonica]
MSVYPLTTPLDLRLSREILKFGPLKWGHHHWTIGVVSPTRRRPGMKQHKSSVPHPHPLHYPNTAQSTIVHSIRVGISEAKLCTSNRHLMFRGINYFDDESTKLTRHHSCEIVNRSAKTKQAVNRSIRVHHVHHPN